MRVAGLIHRAIRRGETVADPCQRYQLHFDSTSEAGASTVVQQLLRNDSGAAFRRFFVVAVFLSVGGMANILTGGETRSLFILVLLGAIPGVFIRLDPGPGRAARLARAAVRSGTSMFSETSVAIGSSGISTVSQNFGRFIAWSGLRAAELAGGGIVLISARRGLASALALAVVFIPGAAFADETQLRECLEFCRDMIARSKAAARTSRSGPSRLSRVFSLLAWYLVLQLWWLGILFSLIAWWPRK